jgi:DNA polymerase-3 subunit delta
MTPAELGKTIRGNKVPPLVYLYGPEQFFVDQAVGQITATIPPDAQDFNLQVAHGRDIPIETLIDSLRTFPVFADRRLVVLRNADKLSASDLETLQAYIEDPVPESILLLVGEKIDKRKKFFQQFAKHGALVEYKRLYDNQLPAFVRDYVAGRNFQLTEDALALFSRRCGATLQEVVGELDKLMQYVGDGGLIDVEDVRQIVSDTRTDSIFDMTNAIGQRQVGEALRLLGRLLAEGIVPLVILSMLTRHFRQLWMTRELLDEGVARTDLARRIGINPYFVDGLMSQARLFGRRQFKSTFERLLATDLALKSSGGSPAALLEQLLLDIARLPE